jgi:hypothetical protein
MLDKQRALAELQTLYLHCALDGSPFEIRMKNLMHSIGFPVGPITRQRQFADIPSDDEIRESGDPSLASDLMPLCHSMREFLTQR